MCVSVSVCVCVCVCVCVKVYSRHWPVAADLNGLQQSRGRHLLTQVVMGVCGQSVVAVDQRDEGQRLAQRMKLQLLRDTERDAADTDLTRARTEVRPNLTSA